MPFYPSTLRTLCEAGIHPDRVLDLFTQVLEGIEAAHERRVWHRDLKPENILYDPPSDTVVVADFGIADFTEDELFTAVETRDQERLANFLYSAPEQRVRGKEVNGRADIFALGLILNEMFTGRVPQGTGIRRITDVAPKYGYLDATVEAMTQQDPVRRPPDIKSVKKELRPPEQA
jgi:serine/threonine protein kinase